MKKILSIFLSVSLAISMAVPAFAAEEHEFAHEQFATTDSVVETYYDQDLDIASIPEIMSGVDFDASIYAERLEEEETDLNSVVLQNKDGTRSLFLFPEPVKYLDEGGNVRDRSASLQYVDDDLVAYAATDNSVKAYYPENFNDQAIVLEYGGNSISVTPMYEQNDESKNFAEMEQTTEHAISLSLRDGVQSSQLVYENVFGGETEVRYTPLLNGYKEDIVLYEAPESNRFSFLVNAEDYTLEIADGMVLFVDPGDGSVAAYMSPIYLYDSGPVPNESFDSYYEIEEIKSGLYVVSIIADAEFLKATDTVYPVYVDPTLTFNTNTSTQEAIIYSGSPSVAHGSNYYSFIGYYDSTYKIGRLLVKIPGLSSNSTYSGLKASELNSVKYYMYCDGTNNAATIRPYVYTGAVWTESTVNYNTATWNGYTALTGMNAVSVPNSAGDVAFDITAAAKAWKNGTYNINKGLMFKNSNESSASYCKTFTSTEYGNKYGSHTPYVIVNYTEFNQTISNLRLYSSVRAPGKNADGTVAGDMTINDKTRPQLYALSIVAGDEGALYDLPPASSSVLPPQGPQAVIDHMMSLATEFTLGDSAMRTVATAMFNHFLDGTGTNFSHSTLTQRVRNHASTQAFVNSNKSIITEYIENNGGDVRGFYTSNAFKQDMYDVPRPAFSSGDDMLNGLKICINDTWGYYVNIKNYSSDGDSYQGTLHFTIYDHFGLDDNDVEKFGWTQGFSAWYTLQHYTGCAGAYVPFITYIEFDVPISGTI